ncbi:MAG: hypothetical protein AAF628_15615 [Planctomycetota bacterium]
MPRHQDTVGPSPGTRLALGFATLLPLLFLFCCAQASTYPLGEEVFPPRPDGHRIAFFDDLDEVPRPYVKVGYIRVEDELFADLPGTLAAEARRVGADALVLLAEPINYDPCNDDEVQTALALRWR